MFKIRRRERGKEIDEKRVGNIVKHELSAYVKQEELKEYLKTVENDKKKKELWDSLTARKKIMVLRYALGKKGEKNGKR